MRNEVAVSSDKETQLYLKVPIPTQSQQTATTVVMCLWRSWILLLSSPQGGFQQSWPRHSLNLKPISSHLQSDTLLRDPCVMVSVGFDNSRVAGFTCPVFPFFLLLLYLISWWIQKTSFLCYNSRAIPNTHRHLTQREILVTTSSVGDMTWILMESKGPLWMLHLPKRHWKNEIANKKTHCLLYPHLSSTKTNSWTSKDCSSKEQQSL